MKTTTRVTVAALFAAGVTMNASALSLTPGNADFQVTQGASADVAAITGTGVTEVYKKNADGTEEKAFEANYSTSFNVDFSGGTVSWDGPLKITGEKIFFFVKDGSPEPQYIFDISNWDGEEDIVFSGFYPAQGSISHVSIFAGAGGPPEEVPEGGATAGLLGLGTLAAAAASRKTKSSKS